MRNNQKELVTMSSVNLSNINIFQKIDSFIRYLMNYPATLQWVVDNLNELYLLFCLTYDDEYDYSETVKAFLGSTKAIVGEFLPNEVIWNEPLAYQFLTMLNAYRERVITSIALQRSQEMDNQYELIKYVNQLLNHYSRLLFVRVDLSYLVDSLTNVKLDDFYEHMSKLRELISNKQTCFEHLQGYAWALEQGTDKSLHCHLLLMYDGAKRQKDVFIGQEVGEKWLAITGSLGNYYNCNNSDYKAPFQQRQLLGIGMIHRDNPLEVQNAIRVARYLVEPEKVDQHLTIRLPNMRTFGKGQFNVPWRRGIENKS